MHDRSRRAVVAAFLANLGIFVAKVAGFLVTGAASMLAEAVHSLADTGNQALLLLGGRRAERPPDREHPFGYGAERFFWAFVVALLLFSLGSLFALAEGIEKLVIPHRLESPGIAIAILLVAMVLEAGSFRTARRQAGPLRGGSSWWGFVRRTKNPELPVVLLEDLGALVGLGFALAGIALAIATGNPRFDALGSVAIGLLLGAIAVVLAVETKSLLIGESAGAEVDAAIVRALLDGPEVRRVIHLRTRHLGPEELLVAAKCDFAATEVDALAGAIDTAEARVRDAVPGARVIYLEPDRFRVA